MAARFPAKIFVILAFVGLATACGPFAAPARTSGSLSFMIFGSAPEKAAYEQLAAAFAERRPSIQVNLVHIPGQSDYLKRLATDFAAGTPADVILLNYRRYGAYAAAGALEPLGPYLAQSRVIKQSDFYPQAIAPFEWNGTLMCIPQNVSSLVVYYNKDLFAQAGVALPQPGWTWDDFANTAQALTRDSNGDGRIDQYGLGTEVSLLRAAPFIWQNGGDLVDDPANPARLALDTPEARAALQWFVDLQVRRHVVPDAVAEEAESSESRFLNGRLAMYLNSRRGVPAYREIETFDWDVAPLPQGRARAGVLHADGYCLTAASRNKPAAWEFIEFANSAEGQQIVAATGRTVPSLRTVAESPAFLNPSVRPQNSRVFLDETAVMRAVPVMAGWVDIEALVDEELQRAYYGQADLDEAIRAAIERAAPFFGR